MSEAPVFFSSNLEKVKPLSVPTDFDVYESLYFATDIDTLISRMSEKINETLREGYGLLNDDFLVRNAVLKGESSVNGICIRQHFYKPLHFETYCTIGQERSGFHDKYFRLCASYLANQIKLQEFITSLKDLETTLPTIRALYRQEYLMHTSKHEYDESIPEHIYKEEHGTHPHVEMYQKAKEEAYKKFIDGEHFVDYYLYNPIVTGTLLRTSENHFTVFLASTAAKEISVDEALATYTFDLPDYVFKSEWFYNEFAKLSLLYLTSNLSADEFYNKLFVLEKG